MTLGPSVDAPDVHVISVEPLERQGVEQRVRVDLRVRNPNNFPLAFEGVRFRLFVNGEPLGQAISGETINLPRLGETIASVTATTTLLDLMRQVARLTERGSALDYRLEGELYLRDPFKRSLRFERSGALPGLRSRVTPAAARIN